MHNAFQHSVLSLLRKQSNNYTAKKTNWLSAEKLSKCDSVIMIFPH
jgi:hypothetical protein